MMKFEFDIPGLALADMLCFLKNRDVHGFRYWHMHEVNEIESKLSFRGQTCSFEAERICFAGFFSDDYASWLVDQFCRPFPDSPRHTPEIFLTHLNHVVSSGMAMAAA